MGDIAVSDGRIAKIGQLNGEGATETIDAEGHIVSPGFVVGHTHFDAQIFLAIFDRGRFSRPPPDLLMPSATSRTGLEYSRR